LFKGEVIIPLCKRGIEGDFYGLMVKDRHEWHHSKEDLVERHVGRRYALQIERGHCHVVEQPIPFQQWRPSLMKDGSSRDTALMPTLSGLTNLGSLLAPAVFCQNLPLREEKHNADKTDKAADQCTDNLDE
jgi:hypothetical protein